jgi:hypothetical protein
MSWPMCNRCLGHLCYLCLGNAHKQRPSSAEVPQKLEEGYGLTGGGVGGGVILGGCLVIGLSLAIPVTP